jgi:hypothetical protein
LKGMNLEEKSTARRRNREVGGHKEWVSMMILLI